MVTGSAPATIILPSSRVAMSPLDGRAPIVTARPPVVRVAARRTPPAVRTPPARVQPAPVPAAPAGYYGSLAIEASPAGARVFINGRLAGTAPIEVRDLAAGSRVVRIEADGYQPWSAAVRIVADQQARISVNLHQAR
jgi:hypothetical protein